MALINCPVCGRLTSDILHECKHCRVSRTIRHSELDRDGVVSDSKPTAQKQKEVVEDGNISKNRQPAQEQKTESSRRITLGNIHPVQKKSFIDSLIIITIVLLSLTVVVIIVINSHSDNSPNVVNKNTEGETFEQTDKGSKNEIQTKEAPKQQSEPVADIPAILSKYELRETINQKYGDETVDITLLKFRGKKLCYIDLLSYVNKKFITMI